MTFKLEKGLHRFVSHVFGRVEVSVVERRKVTKWSQWKMWDPNFFCHASRHRPRVDTVFIHLCTETWIERFRCNKHKLKNV